MIDIKTERYYQTLQRMEQKRTEKQIERAKFLAEQDLQRAMRESLKDCYLGKKDEENKDEKPVERNEDEEKEKVPSKEDAIPKNPAHSAPSTDVKASAPPPPNDSRFQ